MNQFVRVYPIANLRSQEFLEHTAPIYTRPERHTVNKYWYQYI